MFLTVFTKPSDQEPLSKHFSLKGGKLVQAGRSGSMHEGHAHTVEVRSLLEFADLLRGCTSHQALCLGVITPNHRPPVGEQVPVKMAKDVSENEKAIARSQKYMDFDNGPGMLFVDKDTKGMPPAVTEKLKELGGLVPALLAIEPGLEGAGLVWRGSASSGLYNKETGADMPSSAGEHLYIPVLRAADVKRATTALSRKAWLNGLGWHIVSEAGSILERSIVDVAVASRERLIFEGAPVLDEPLGQRPEAREPVVSAGEVIDSAVCIPDLTPEEMTRYRTAIATSKRDIEPEALRVRAQRVNGEAEDIVRRTGATHEHALRQAREKYNGRLGPDILLDFDDEKIGLVPVADVLREPARYADATLSDPIEGPAYGRGKAKILRRENGEFIINSFAHGGMVFKLCANAAIVAEVIRTSRQEQVVDRFAQIVSRATLTVGEAARLRREAKRAAGNGVTLKDIDNAVKAVEAARREEEKQRKRALDILDDPRPRLPFPEQGTELTAYVKTVDEHMARDESADRPLRDLNGQLTKAVARAPSILHSLGEKVRDEEGEKPMPAPPDIVLSTMSSTAIAMAAEAHVCIEKETRDGTTKMALPQPFCAALNELGAVETRIPTCTGVQLLPVVTTDGKLHAESGFDADLGLLFRMDPTLRAVLPPDGVVSVEEARAAYDWLVSTWLGDVQTSAQGKAILIALTMTIIERHLLAERPAFLISSGQRGGGKTTVLSMVSAAAIGHRASAHAWAQQEEERRKAIFAICLTGAPFVVFDNIKRGEAIRSPHLALALTATRISDRILGETSVKQAPSTTVFAFTGNNIKPNGELASRTLNVLIDVLRADPENREFMHPRPVDWTLANRAKILSCIYKILLVERQPVADVGTRFKDWMSLVGRPIELVTGLSFKNIFAMNEEDDQEATGAAEFFAHLLEVFGTKRFKARDVRDLLDHNYGAPPTHSYMTNEERAKREDRRNEADALRKRLGDALERDIPSHERPNEVTVGLWLKGLVGRHVEAEGVTLTLKSKCINRAHLYWVWSSAGDVEPTRDLPRAPAEDDGEDDETVVRGVF